VSKKAECLNRIEPASAIKHSQQGTTAHGDHLTVAPSCHLNAHTEQQWFSQWQSYKNGRFGKET